MIAPRPVARGFRPYVWAEPTASIAARHGLDPSQVLRFDANVSPLPGVPQVPLGESLARLNEYPDGTYRELREAAASYAGVEPTQVVVGAGADDLIALVARAYLAPGRRAAVRPPTYPVYAIASMIEGAEVVEESAGAAVIWRCNPDNPSGELEPPERLAEFAREHPDALVVVDEAYWEYAGATAAPLVAESPNLVVLRTLSKAFGLAALRVGYALASEEVASVLEARRSPAPVSAPAARIAAAALREPRLDVETTVAERERMREALLAAGWDCPPSHASFLLVRSGDAAELEAQGLVVRRFPDAIRVTVRRPAENDRLLAALGAATATTPRRSALVLRTTAETSLRVSLDLDGRGRARVETGIGFLDHLLEQLAFHSRVDLELLAGGDLDVDEHHTVEDVLASLGGALAQALGPRDGLVRYGAATVPMDEAKASAAVDLVRRPHAEVALRFAGPRVGGLAPTLLPHALERLAAEGGFTLHVDSKGDDDHHVAEAAFKALGRALGQACARDGNGGISTKGVA